MGGEICDSGKNQIILWEEQFCRPGGVQAEQSEYSVDEERGDINGPARCKGSSNE